MTADARIPRPPEGYLDAVGGQPILPQARQAWVAASEQAWSDPARLHHAGRRAGMVLDAARASLASGLDSPAEQVHLTSSGPSAVAAAVTGLLAQRPRAARIVASAVESLAVLHPALAACDDVDLVPVDPAGRIDLAALRAALDAPAALVAVQAANPEVGSRQPLAEVHAMTQEAGVPLLVHAVQVIGRGPVPEAWDVLAASARDWAGPAGVGVLAVRPSARWAPDASPDRGWLSGFPDIPGAAAAATALEEVRGWGDAEAVRVHALTTRLRAALPDVASGITVTGHDVDRLPHIVTFTCTGVVGEQVVHGLSRRGFSVASGSACTSDARMPSQVLAAMGVRADASVRVSLPFGCTAETVEGFLDALPEALAEARD